MLLMVTTNEDAADDRFVRQRGLIATEAIAEHPVTIIGVGAIGRQVALQLAAIGVRRIQLVDFDSVELHNVTTQGYRLTDVKQLKVLTTAQAIAEVDPDVIVDQVADRFRPKLTHSDVVFCCVDSISARAAIWKHVQKRCRFWSDGRMLGEVIRVLTSTDTESAKQYAESLFPPS